MGVVVSNCFTLDYRSRYGHCLPLYLSDTSSRNPQEQCGDCVETFVEAMLRGVGLEPMSPRRSPDKAMETYEIMNPKQRILVLDGEHPRVRLERL